MRWLNFYFDRLMEAEADAYEARAALHGIDLRKKRSAPVTRKSLEAMGFRVGQRRVPLPSDLPRGPKK